MSFDDFEELLLDKPDNERWELIGGRVIRSRVGARWEHERIAGNIYMALQTHFRARKSICRAFKETFFLRADQSKILPDVFVHCSNLDNGEISVDDARVIVEILSPATEYRDRHDKWEVCRQLPSLRHYVLIRHDRPFVELKSRGGNGWITALFEGLNGTLALPAIAFEMPLTAVYEDVLSG